MCVCACDEWFHGCNSKSMNMGGVCASLFCFLVFTFVCLFVNAEKLEVGVGYGKRNQKKTVCGTCENLLRRMKFLR